MRLFQVLLTTMAVLLCDAAPQLKNSDASADILDQYNNRPDDKSWNWGFRTSNGIARDEDAFVNDEGVPSVAGSYSWTAPDGVAYHVTYSAGRGGYAADVRRTRPQQAGPRPQQQDKPEGALLLPGKYRTSLLCDASLASLCG